MTEDKKERLRLISVGVLANYYLSDQHSCGMIPLPVFKDEFLEGRLSDGTYFKTCYHIHSPPKNKFELHGPNECYKYEGIVQTSAGVANFNPNYLVGCRKGKSILTLKNGTEYKIGWPTFAIDSALTCKKSIRYTNKTPAYVWDKTNQLIVWFYFREKEFGWMGGGLLELKIVGKVFEN